MRTAGNKIIASTCQTQTDGWSFPAALAPPLELPPTATIGPAVIDASEGNVWSVNVANASRRGRRWNI
jgi:hypothetical protein